MGLASAEKSHRRRLFTDQMQHDFAFVRLAPMLEQVNPLPGAECELGRHDWNRKRGMRQRRADMRRHVVGSLRGVHVLSSWILSWTRRILATARRRVLR